MSRKLYFGQAWNEPGYLDSWISFEDNPEFSLTGAKSKICQACLASLRKGLLSYKVGRGVDVGLGAHCWKAVLTMESLRNARETQDMLETYQDDFLPGETGIHGKVGGGETPGQQQIMMHCDSASEAGMYMDEIREWLRKHHNNPLNSYSIEQGCKHPFLELFGPVSHRTEKMEPIRPAVIPKVIEMYLKDEIIAHRR